MGRRRHHSSHGGAGVLVVVVIVLWVVAIVATYALVVAAVGGVLALREARNRKLGRAYVPPGQRFLAVWTRAVSPVDPRNWVTPERMPATDPALLPGKVSGDLRVQDRGVRRVDEPGPYERLVVEATITNHGTSPVRLGDLDDIDVQVWTPNGQVIGAEAEWSDADLPPGTSRDVAVSVRVPDHQPVGSWAVGHRARGGDYVFFTAESAGRPSAEPR